MSAPPLNTVAGEPLANNYDIVLAHEHLRVDIRCWFDAASPFAGELQDLQVTPDTAAAVQRDPFACLDNLLLDDRELIADELKPLGRYGRVLVVDVTPENVGRDVALLEQVSTAAGVDVVFGCGLYIAESAPGASPQPAEVYRDAILAQFDGHGPRPAVIGEIGTGNPIKPLERASLTGAAMAHGELGIPLYVHLHPWARRGHEALDLIEAHGGDLERVVLCHLDVQIPGGLSYHRQLLRRGCRIAFDIWGDEFPYGEAGMPSDRQRMEATLRLIDDGFGHQLVHSQDVCTKTQLHRFGGAGYDHIPRTVRPALARLGLSGPEIHRQLAGNALALILERDGRS